ncbi:MAG: polyketide cyclase, partial [Ginsengibacter sp.]
DVEVRFERPMQGIAFAPIVTEAVSENKTKVKWGMNGKSKYPFNFMNLFMDNILGKDLQTSLATLKNVLEK